MRKLRSLLLFIPVLLWLTAVPCVRAQTLSVDPNVVINGTLGTGSTNFTRTITLTLSGTGTEAKQIQIKRSDLTKEGSTEIIDRGNVSVGAASLKPGQTADVGVTINNVSRAGKYTGTIKFWLPEQTEADAQVCNVTLQVGPRIAVVPPTAGSAQIAHCGIFPCAWSHWLPQNLVGNKRGLLIDNQTIGNVPIERYDVILRGDKTGRILTAAEVRPRIASAKPPDCLPNCLPASSSVPVDLEIINKDSIPPDSYVGALRLGLAGADTPSVVNFTLNVRSAPWWPLLVLLFGVIAGRLVKNMSTPEAVLQIKLLKRLFRIQDSVLDLRSDRDRQFLLRHLDDLKARIESGSETEQALTQALDKEEVTARLLRRLEALKDEASKLTDPVLSEQILKKINEAADTLVGGDAVKCAQLITEIEISLRQAQKDLPDDAADELTLVNSALDSVREARATGDEAVKVFKVPPAKVPGGPARVMATLAGTDLIGAGTRFFVLRPIFFVALLILLTLVGLKSLYIDNGTTFGSGGLYDYLGLFMWGLSAEIAQRTLQTLTLPRT